MRLLRSIRIVVLAAVDFLVPRRSDTWVFPAYFIGPGSFNDNARAVFEEVRHDPSIRKVVLRRTAPLDVDGANVEVLEMGSYRAAWRLMRARVIFVQHSLWLDYAKAKLQIVATRGRIVVNLWHGIPIKDISHDNTGIHGRRGLREMPAYHIPCSSAEDLGHMRSAFGSTPADRFWLTGLPRCDTLLQPEDRLPMAYRDDLERLRMLKRGRRLVVYAPTYRETQVGGSYYAFSPAEIEAMEDFGRRHGCVFGIRYHLYRRPDGFRDLVGRDTFVDLSAERFPDMRVVVRETDVLVTDYSSVFLDALYLGVPCLCFGYDRDHYERTQRGMFYSLDELFGDQVCDTLDALLAGIATALEARRASPDQAAQALSARFFRWRDAGNSARVVACVKNAVSVERRWPGIA